MYTATNRLAAERARKSPRPWTARRSALGEAMASVATRRYDVSWMDSSGQTASFARVGPAVPLFEEAFSALARGALVQTKDGPVAVEDLAPGMIIETGAGPAPLAWIGAITLVPDQGLGRGTPPKLYRVTTDAFGLERPIHDLMLGPGARVLSRSPSALAATGADKALAPINAFADGSSVIEISPVSPVRVFHLGFHGHRILRANGVELESYHPGQMLLGRLGPEMGALFMSLFPHLDDFSGFGRLAAPRLSEDELDQLFYG